MDKKILIFDDEAHIRALLHETLEEIEDLGVDIFFADDGEAGLALILREKPQLVFLDVMMPKMNGFELATIIRNRKEFDDLYLIMLTAKGQVQDVKDALAAGAHSYVVKPFNLPDLVERIEKLLS